MNASERYEKPDFFLSEERELFPEVSMTAHQRDLPFDGKSRRCFEQWLDDVPCFGDRPQYPAARTSSSTTRLTWTRSSAQHS